MSITKQILKPCPFCGAAARAKTIQFDTGTPGDHCTLWGVECSESYKNCRIGPAALARGPYCLADNTAAFSDADTDLGAAGVAVALWNKRKNDKR
jgi:hypothetical protein